MKQEFLQTFRPETVKQIEEIATVVADQMIQDTPPDPLKPQSFTKNKLKLEMEKQISDFFGVSIQGIKALLSTLSTLSATDSAINMEQTVGQLLSFSESLKTLGADQQDNRSPKERAQITEETMKTFNSAAAFLYQNGEFDKAKDVYAFLSFLDPAEPAFYLGWGNAEYFLKNYEKAIQVYETLSKVEPTNPYSFLYTAHCYHGLNQMDQALDCVDKAIEVIKTLPIQENLLDEAETLKAMLKNQR